MNDGPLEAAGNDQPRRFLLVAGFPDSILHFRGHLLSEIQSRGYEVHVAAPELDDQSGIGLAMARRGIRVHAVPLDRTGTSPLGDVRALWALLSLIRLLSPEVVLSYTVKPVIYGSIAATLLDVPRRFALITGRGTYLIDDASRSLFGRAVTRIVRFLYTLALRGVDQVFFQNPDDEALFRAGGIVGSASRTHVVNGSGVDLDEFVFEPAPKGQPIYLMVARLLGSKGVREYSAAAKRLRAEIPDVRIYLAGWLDQSPDSVTEDELRGWIDDGTIDYLGRLSDVRPALSRCSVFVLPSYGEGTPRSVLEALATGRAVITTDAPGCRETVVDGVNGFLIPPRSPDALEEAMRRFVNDHELAQRMGEESRRIAKERYDVHRVNEVMLREMGVR